MSLMRWVKIRVSYLLNSWIYTTNHKRIAINYFNLVLVGGTAGMSLATVIRLEFAYPGVGILAGDSIQYLCIVTAHGVIMVFFMIMPAIFGAFGNFLLPTQLGVHDVAFPRLNSAAFWLFPGSLIMLFQLVCVDRRYQRMNCFNIREMQGILKRKFFTDLVNTSDNRLGADSMVVNMRYKNNMASILSFDQSLFYNYDLTTLSKYKSFFINPSTYTYTTLLIKFNLNNFIKVGINTYVINPHKTFFSLLKELSNPIVYMFSGYIFYPLTATHTNLTNLKYFFISNFYLNSLSSNSKISIPKHTLNHLNIKIKPETNQYVSNPLDTLNLRFLSLSKFSDLSNT